MNNVMSVLKDRRAKAEAKVTRATKALESAKKDLADVLAAERVMAEITGESVDQKSGPSLNTQRDRDIAKLLGTSENDALSPVLLYPIYQEATGDQINLEAFRTAVWRLKNKTVEGEQKSWTVRAENGRYWREPAGLAIDDFDDLLGGDDPDAI